jgi:hypothetical protein
LGAVPFAGGLDTAAGVADDDEARQPQPPSALSYSDRSTSGLGNARIDELNSLSVGDQEEGTDMLVSPTCSRMRLDE